MRSLWKRFRQWRKYGRVFPDYYFTTCPKCGYEDDWPGDTCIQCLWSSSPDFEENMARIDRIIASGITHPAAIIHALLKEDEERRRLN